MKKAVLFLIALCVIIAGCDKKMAPNCDSQEVKDLVLEQAWSEFISGMEMIGMSAEDVKSFFNIELKDVKTTDSDKNTGKQSCSATIAMSAETGDSEDFPITYTTNLEKNGGFFVELSEME